MGDAVMNVCLQQNQGGVVEVAVAGPVTQAQLSATDDPLARLLGPDLYDKQLLLDLRDTNLIDTSGISWLLKTHRRAREGGGRLILHSLPPLVDNVLKVLRMNQVFEIAADRSAARAMIEGAQA
jgi:anti-anti-sigma factor